MALTRQQQDEVDRLIEMKQRQQQTFVDEYNKMNEDAAYGQATGGVLRSAATGAALGSMFGGLPGAGIGALAGGALGLFGAAKARKDRGQGWGEATGRSIFDVKSHFDPRNLLPAAMQAAPVMAMTARPAIQNWMNPPTAPTQGDIWGQQWMQSGGGVSPALGSSPTDAAWQTPMGTMGYPTGVPGAPSYMGGRR